MSDLGQVFAIQNANKLFEVLKNSIHFDLVINFISFYLTSFLTKFKIPGIFSSPHLL